MNTFVPNTWVLPVNVFSYFPDYISIHSSNHLSIFIF